MSRTRGARRFGAVGSSAGTLPCLAGLDEGGDLVVGEDVVHAATFSFDRAAAGDRLLGAAGRLAGDEAGGRGGRASCGRSCRR